MLDFIKRNIMINKVGGNASKSAVNYRISLPAEWIKKLGVSVEDRTVQLEFKNNTIIII